jgi:hypothetical protein
MPRDVSTRWNSTFDMLEFAINYRKVIDVMTDKRKLGLGVYELDDHEWTLVTQLRDVLKVSDMSHITQAVTDLNIHTARSSSTLLNTSCAQLPILRWSSLQWTILTRLSPMVSLTLTSLTLLFVQH